MNNTQEDDSDHLWLIGGDKVTFWQVALCSFVLMFIAAMAVIALYGDQRHMSAETYYVWCKLHGRADITFEEWKSAQRAGLLNAPPAIQSETTVVQQPQSRFR